MVVELPMKELNRVVIVTDVNVVTIVSDTGCTCFYSVGWSLFHVDFQILVFSHWILLKSTYSVNIQRIQMQRWSSGQQHSRPLRRDIITLPVKTIRSFQKSLQRGCDLQALHMKPHVGPFFHTFAPTLCTSDFTRMVKKLYKLETPDTVAYQREMKLETRKWTHIYIIYSKMNKYKRRTLHASSLHFSYCTFCVLSASARLITTCARRLWYHIAGR